MGFDVQNQGFDAGVDSSLGASGRAGSTVLSSLFRFDGAFYTPALLDTALAPRLLVHAGMQVPLSESSVVYQNNQTGLDPSTFLPRDLTSEITSFFDFNWRAGLGVEIALPIGGRAFRLQPSVDYFGQSLQFDGEVTRVNKDFFGTPLQSFSVSGSSSEIVHSLGPRLTLDIEAARVGSFALNVFLESQFYWVLSEREFAFGGQSPDGTADFRVKLRPLLAQGGAGLRIVWRGD